MHPPSDARLLGEVVMFEAQPLIVLDAFRDIGLHVPKLLVQAFPLRRCDAGSASRS